MCDIDLFDNMGYDSYHSTDHFFRDNLRTMCTLSLPPSEPLTYAYYMDQVLPDEKLESIVAYFNGYSRGATPLKWDRVAALQLLLKAFIAAVGYDDLHRRTESSFDKIARSIVSPVFRENLSTWIEGLKLRDKAGTGNITHALERSMKTSHSSGAA